jgi:hypothetical protein
MFERFSVDARKIVVRRRTTRSPSPVESAWGGDSRLRTRQLPADKVADSASCSPSVRDCRP